MNSAAILLDIVVVLYACASILYLWGIVSEASRARRMASITALLGLLVHGALIADICLARHTMALTNLFGSLLFVAWSLMAIYLINERKYRITALGAFAAILCLSMVGVASTLPNGVNETLRPPLRSHWGVIHITSCLLGYAGFILAFGAAICYVIQEYMLKAKRINRIQRHLPSLDVADHLAYTMVSFGFPLFTLGIVTGALWAQTAWNSYWSWDPQGNLVADHVAGLRGISTRSDCQPMARQVGESIAHSGARLRGGDVYRRQFLQRWPAQL